MMMLGPDFLRVAHVDESTSSSIRKVFISLMVKLLELLILDLIIVWYQQGFNYVIDQFSEEFVIRSKDGYLD